MNELYDALCEICQSAPQKITLSNPKSPLNELKKVSARPLSDCWQIERFTENQAFQQICDESDLPRKLYEFMCDGLRQCNAVCVGVDYELKLSKKGKLLKNCRKNSVLRTESTEHNRKKNYILEDGIFVPALFELGVMTSSGKVVAQKYDKFKQINRFIECVDDALKSNDEETTEIVDFGCGKSYLTFVLYYYFTVLRKKRVHIVGLDLKRDVIDKCTEIAKKYKYDGLEFLCCDIKDYKPKKAPTMVVTLHACDVATDYALYNAIRWNAKYIFSVPCCQHELNGSSKFDCLSFMTDYGLIKERLCALATDSVRARLLELNGYRTDVLEFIDMENSPKNLLIRARLSKIPNLYKQNEIRKHISDFETLFGTRITLQNLLYPND